MELDELKARAREISAPADMDHAGRRGQDLLRAIKTADEQSARQVRQAKPLYATAAVAFILGSALTVGSIAPAAASRSLHLGVLAFVLLLIALLLHGRARSLARVDYSKPVKDFLAEAEQRHRLVRPSDLAYSIPLLLLLAFSGGRLVVDEFVPRYVDPERTSLVVWTYAVVFLLVCGLGWFFTYRNWQRDTGSVWTEIRRMRDEME